MADYFYRLCSRCKNKFRRKKESRTKAPYCRVCQRLYQKRHYKKNKQYYIDKAQVRKIKIREQIRRIKERPCRDCGVQYPYYVMDFDHRNGKTFTISTSHNTKGWQTVMTEIAKCDVVCANCHRERTHLRSLSSAE